jgi:hypothetical protein
MGTTILRLQWAEVASRPLWPKALFALGACGYIVAWGRIVRETYGNVRRDVREMPQEEPSTLTCSRCGERYLPPLLQRARGGTLQHMRGDPHFERAA